jgi:preprotein translocase subunit SecG
MAGINFESVSYTLGIISIVLAFFSPTAGLIIGIIGFIQAKRMKSRQAKKLNIIGIILGVIFFIISVILSIYATQLGGSSGFPFF